MNTPKPKKPSPKQVKRLEALWHKWFRHRVQITRHDQTKFEKVLDDREIFEIREGRTIEIELMEEQKPTAEAIAQAEQLYKKPE